MNFLARWLCNLAYFLAISLMLPWMLWRHLAGKKQRSGWHERLLGPKIDLRDTQDSTLDARAILWIHAVSVGEVNLLGTFVPAIRQAYPQYRIAISASTDSGLELASERFKDCITFRFPIDFSWAINRVLRQLRPVALVLTELEVWPNTLSLLREKNIPVAVINGRLSDTSFRNYQRLGMIGRSLFSKLQLVVAQSEEYTDRFTQLGVPNGLVHLAGSIKFDAVRTQRNNAQTVALQMLVGIKQDDIVWLAGSTSEPEESVVIATFCELRSQLPALRLIIVPRHPERFKLVDKLLQQAGVHYIRRSQVSTLASPWARNQSSEFRPDWEVLLVDTIGELSHWWGAADIGYVGGSLGNRGGQSMIEPAGFGVATSFGPNTKNFRDIVGLLLASEAAVVVHDGKEMAEFVHKCYRDAGYREALGCNAQQLAIQQQGATGATILALKAILER